MNDPETEQRLAEWRQRRSALIALTADLATFVLPGEPCPEACNCDSDDGRHGPSQWDLRDALRLFVERARDATR